MRKAPERGSRRPRRGKSAAPAEREITAEPAVERPEPAWAQERLRERLKLLRRTWPRDPRSLSQPASAADWEEIEESCLSRTSACATDSSWRLKRRAAVESTTGRGSHP